VRVGKKKHDVITKGSREGKKKLISKYAKTAQRRNEGDQIQEEEAGLGVGILEKGGI